MNIDKNSKENRITKNQPSTFKYAVMNENTLGYFADYLEGGFGIIHGSVLKGSTHDWRHGYTIIAPTDVIRKATAADFEEYRVKLPPDFNEEQGN